MGIVRLLVRAGILALFVLAAVVVMTVLFSVQVRFDQQAELQMKGLEASRTPITVTVTASPSAEAHEESLAAREARRTADPATIGAADAITASIQPPALIPAQVNELLGIGNPTEPTARIAADTKLAEGAVHRSPGDARPVNVSDPIKAAREPDDDRFASVRINRPGTGSSVHRVPRER